MRIDKFYKVFQHCYNSFQMEKSSRLEELYYFRQQFYFILYQAYTLTQCKRVKANGKNILKNIKKIKKQIEKKWFYNKNMKINTSKLYWMKNLN